MGLVYGIDFGTTASAVMIGHPGGDPPVRIRDRGSVSGSFAVPSSVCVLPDGTPVVGAAAERAKLSHPDRYFSEFKRDFGVTGPRRLGAVSVRPHDLAAQVLRYLRELAEERVPEAPDLVVITVPAAWEGGNRDLMTRAAALAGYDPAAVRLREEPVAAAAYAVAGTGGGTTGPDAGAGGDSRRTLVYDLGGGTFDCALVAPVTGDPATAVGRVDAGGAVEVLGVPGGLDDVGGGTFDRAILGELRRRFPELAAKLLDGPPADPDAARRRLTLLDACEELKIQLSVADGHEVYLHEVDPPARFGLTRARLAELIRPLLRETIAECERMLAALGFGWPDVARIVPVGGSSRLPLVGELLARHTGRPVEPVEEPELAVAHGAVLLARELAFPSARTASAAAHGQSAPRQYSYHPERSPFERD
ncbi:MAG TPA: Hsp70 family protein [Actinocrinis sp.]|nr:Hsp70 family protein [Actinocrinis sp.]